jgi:anti-sigma factor ChrR (cupin superfamily)
MTQQQEETVSITSGRTAAPGGARSVTVLRDIFSAEGRATLPWTTWTEPGRAGTDLYPLYTTESELPASAQLIRFAPGAHGDLHEHLGYELMIVLEGELRNDNGDRYHVGDLIIEEPGSTHQISTDTGCVLFGVREAPTVPLR